MAIFAHSSSGPVPLRTLTLGVLIVSGGTLAALPFRRYQAIPDSSTSPVHVTGPTHSALQMGQLDAIAGDAFLPPQITDAMLPGSILATHASAGKATGPQAQTQPPATQEATLASRKRQFDVPLTYEDLVLPIEVPGVVQERFNATAAVQSIQMEKKRMANKAQPRMETIVATEKQTPDETTDSVFASSTPNVGEPRIMQPGSASASAMHPRVAQPNLAPRETTAGTLASTPVTPAASSNADPLDATAILPDLGSHDQPPSIASQAQQRHWIRQPK